jgi:hypothetical protein
MTKLAGSASGSESRSGSGSTPKCPGSATLLTQHCFLAPVLSISFKKLNYNVKNITVLCLLPAPSGTVHEPESSILAEYQSGSGSRVLMTKNLQQFSAEKIFF